MDEILIGEKNYVSSKRAAKMTGYAKDYIGQLCREGRVPARLVGRSWYVLETAIQDHRFGTTDIQPEKIAVTPPASSPTTWESPRYEASSDEPLPPVKRLRGTDQQLQDSWKAWFDRVADSEPVALSTLAVHEKQEPREEVEEKPEAEVIEEEAEAVNIPVRTVYELPPEDLLPRHLVIRQQNEEEENNEEPVQEGHRSGNGLWAFIRTIQVAGALVAVLIATFAVIGTGYFDEYILSSSQARLIAGVALYNK